MCYIINIATSLHRLTKESDEIMIHVASDYPIIGVVVTVNLSQFGERQHKCITT